MNESVQPLYTKTAFRAAIMLLAGLIAQHGNASPSVSLPTLMQGHLIVSEQSGSACETPTTMPLHLPVWAVYDQEQWWLWGDMAPMRLQPQGESAMAVILLPWVGDMPAGQVRWQKAHSSHPQQPVSEHSARAIWQETENPTGCAFTQAKLHLQAFDPAGNRQRAEPGAAQLHAHHELLAQTLARAQELNAITRRQDATKPLQQLIHLTSRMPAAPTAATDATLALTWLQAGERASALSHHNSAAALQQAAVAIYQRLAIRSARHQENAALAMGSLARTQARSGQIEAAQATLQAALNLLEPVNEHPSAAASIYNQQGALWLRLRQPGQALRSFTQGMYIDENRMAPAVERVVTLMNSAVALEELGQLAAAQKVYEQCQALLANAPVSADQDRLSQWVHDRLQALTHLPGASLSL